MRSTARAHIEEFRSRKNILRKAVRHIGNVHRVLRKHENCSSVIFKFTMCPMFPMSGFIGWLWRTERPKTKQKRFKHTVRTDSHPDSNALCNPMLKLHATETLVYAKSRIYFWAHRTPHGPNSKELCGDTTAAFRHNWWRKYLLASAATNAWYLCKRSPKAGRKESF